MPFDVAFDACADHVTAQPEKWRVELLSHRAPDRFIECTLQALSDGSGEAVHLIEALDQQRIIVLYNRLRGNPGVEMTPRTFFFAGKAAPAYQLAKLVIKFINNLAGTIDGDPIVRGRMKVVFLPEYNVSLAERLLPASDVSN